MIFSVQTKIGLSTIATFALTFSLLGCGCQKNDNAAPASHNQKSTQTAAISENNGSLSSSLPKTASTFDATRAWQDLTYQVEIGPRYVGSAGSQQTRQWLIKNLSDLGCQIYEQKFTAQTVEGSKEFVNIIASLEPSSTTQKATVATKAQGESADESLAAKAQSEDDNKVADGQAKVKETTTIVLGAHYDTKYFKDLTFIGANDGASGTAVLLELARVFKNKPLQQHKLMFCFFDGEEAFGEWSDIDGTYGSRYFVENLGKPTSPVKTEVQDIVAAVIVDMVGDKNLHLTYDTISHPQLLEMLFNKGRELKFTKQFKRSDVGAISDDHLPFLLAKIPAVNMIGFNNNENGLYPSYWHTAEDTLDKVCADSLYTVGVTADLFVRDLDNVLE